MTSKWTECTERALDKETSDGPLYPKLKTQKSSCGRKCCTSKRSMKWRTSPVLSFDATSPWDCTYQLQKIQLDHSWHRRMRKDKLFLTATWVALSGQEKNDTPTEKMCLWNIGTISQRSSFGIIFDRGKRHVRGIDQTLFLDVCIDTISQRSDWKMVFFSGRPLRLAEFPMHEQRSWLWSLAYRIRTSCGNEHAIHPRSEGFFSASSEIFLFLWVR